MKYFVLFLLLSASALAQGPVENTLYLTVGKAGGGLEQKPVADPGVNSLLFWNESTNLWGSTPAIDGIPDNWIAWGIASGQVSAADIPIEDAGGNFTATNVETALAELFVGGGGGGGTTVSVDGTPAAALDFVSSGDIDFTNTAGAVTGNINAGVIALADLQAALQASLALADSALQPGDIGTTVQGFSAQVSGGEITAGTETALRTYSPADVKAFVDQHGGSGSGDVVGPASSIDNRIVTFDGVTGKLIQDSGSLVADFLADGADTVDDTNINWANVTLADLVGAQVAPAVSFNFGSAASFTLPATSANGLLTLNNALSIKNGATSQGYALFFEDSDFGTNAITLRPPANLAASWTFTMPGNTGTSGYLLSTDGAGLTSWVAPGSVADDSITNAKLANMATSTIKGRTTIATGNPEDLTPAQVRTMLNVEDGAAADMTGAEIKAAYEGELDTNAYDDAAVAKLAGIEAGATADQSAAEIQTAYESLVGIMSQAAAEAGTSTTAERVTPQRLKQAIDALAVQLSEINTYAGLDGIVADDTLIADSNFEATLEAGGPYDVPLNALEFEGATVDANQTTVTVVDPTAPRTITLKDETGTVAFLTDIDDIAVSALADGTDGELITWDATGAPATVPAGTAGQVLTSNGAGAAPTFQAGGAGSGDFLADGSVAMTGNLNINTQALEDANSNELMTFGTTASAVNHVQVANAATGSGPTISAVGDDDTDISLTIGAKGAGTLLLGSELNINGQIISNSGAGVIPLRPGGDQVWIGSQSSTEGQSLRIYDGGVDNAPGVMRVYADDGTHVNIFPRTNGRLAAHTAAPTDDDTDGVDVAMVSDLVKEKTLALSDLTTSVTAGATVLNYWDAPAAITLTDAWGTALTAPTGSGIVIDIHVGAPSADGTGAATIMTTDKIDISATEFQSGNLANGTATAPALTTTAVTAGQRLFFFIDSVGSTEGGKGIQATIQYTVD